MGNYFGLKRAPSAKLSGGQHSLSDQNLVVHFNFLLAVVLIPVKETLPRDRCPDSSSPLSSGMHDRGVCRSTHEGLSVPSDTSVAQLNGCSKNANTRLLQNKKRTDGFLQLRCRNALRLRCIFCVGEKVSGPADHHHLAQKT